MLFAKGMSKLVPKRQIADLQIFTKKGNKLYCPQITHYCSFTNTLASYPSVYPLNYSRESLYLRNYYIKY